MDPMNFLEVTDVLELLSCQPILNDDEFKELVTKRPKLMIRVLKKYGGTSLHRVLVRHRFVSDKHHLEFIVEINLLLKLILSINAFKGSLLEAKELTNLLMKFGCDFDLNLIEYEKWRKLFMHNIAISLCSVHDRIQWQFRYIWFLAKKPQFLSLTFKELPDYLSGEAVPILRRIDGSRLTTRDKCRKFVTIQLICGNFLDFDDIIKANCLELLDLHSLKLLLYFGFDFRKCLIESFGCEDNTVFDECSQVFEEQCPRLMKFLADSRYFQTPLPLKDMIRIQFRRREGPNLNRVAKRLHKTGWIPEGLSDYLRYKSFVQF